MAYFLFMILAIGAMPLDGVARTESRLERRLGQLGLIIFVAGWVLYIVVLPGMLGQRFSGEVVVDSPMSMVLGVAVIVQAAFRWRRSASRRSRAIAGAIVLASLMLLATDLLNLLSVAGVLQLNDGQWTDAFWALPGVAMVLMVRLRHCGFPPAPSARIDTPDTRERMPLALGTYLMFGGLSFLLIDALLRLGGFVATTDYGATIAVELTLIASSVSLITLAAISNWLLNERSARLRAERRQVQTRLDEANKMEALGRLAGGVAHDFNNLLTVVGGTSELALAEMPLDSPTRALLRMNREAVGRAAALTRQLLVFSRRQVEEASDIDANAVIAKMLAMLSRIIGETIRINVRATPALPLVRINLNQFEQVVLNLVVNARDAMAGVGSITITTHTERLRYELPAHSGVLSPGAYVIVSVSDTGPGIDDAVRPHIFEPFFTTKAADGSRGVGLATAYGIVAQNGGAFMVYNCPGSGATLSFYLPVSVASTDSAPLPAPATARIGTETVLLAEDDDAVRTLTRSLLESCNYTVLEAATPGAALEICRTHNRTIHLLLTDVIMPEINGPELSRRALALRPEMRVLFMSGYAGDSAAPDGEVFDASNFIAKPFSLDALIAKVREVLDASRATSV
jgi:signal transduction histidine kinase/CheY-like chemotaxis protein